MKEIKRNLQETSSSRKKSFTETDFLARQQEQLREAQAKSDKEYKQKVASFVEGLAMIDKQKKELGDKEPSNLEKIRKEIREGTYEHKDLIDPKLFGIKPERGKSSRKSTVDTETGLSFQQTTGRLSDKRMSSLASQVITEVYTGSDSQFAQHLVSSPPAFETFEWGSSERRTGDSLENVEDSSSLGAIQWESSERELDSLKRSLTSYKRYHQANTSERQFFDNFVTNLAKIQNNDSTSQNYKDAINWLETQNVAYKNGTLEVHNNSSDETFKTQAVTFFKRLRDLKLNGISTFEE